MPQKLKDLVKSRKFWAAVIGVVVVSVKGVDPNFPLSDDQLTGALAVLIAYILGTAIEDQGSNPAARS